MNLLVDHQDGFGILVASLLYGPLVFDEGVLTNAAFATIKCVCMAFLPCGSSGAWPESPIAPQKLFHFIAFVWLFS